MVRFSVAPSGLICRISSFTSGGSFHPPLKCSQPVCWRSERTTISLVRALIRPRVAPAWRIASARSVPRCPGSRVSIRARTASLRRVGGRSVSGRSENATSAATSDPPERPSSASWASLRSASLIPVRPIEAETSAAITRTVRADTISPPDPELSSGLAKAMATKAQARARIASRIISRSRFLRRTFRDAFAKNRRVGNCTRWMRSRVKRWIRIGIAAPKRPAR